MKFPALAFVAFALLGAPAAAQTATASPAPSASPTATATPAPTPKPFTIGGFADVGYTSVSGANSLNFSPQYGGGSARVFDTVDKQPQFHALSLTAAYNTTPFGGKAEVILGDDADVINSYPKFPRQSEFDLTQAYLSYTAGKFTLIGGKFETLAGAEVIESPSDLEHSRSILFGYAVPFTHTGLRGTWAFSPQFSGILGVNKGWDTTSTIGGNGDSGKLTTEAGIAWNPGKYFSLTTQGYSGGVEQLGKIFNQRRSLLDIVATYHATDALQFILNIDAASQTNTVPQTAGLGTATWSGVAGYVNYQWTPKWAATLRAETFRDANGVRSGVGVPLNWREGTATLAYTPAPPLIFRLEARGDRADTPVFTNSGTGTNSLTTLGFEAIVKF